MLLTITALLTVTMLNSRESLSIGVYLPQKAMNPDPEFFGFQDALGILEPDPINYREDRAGRQKKWKYFNVYIDPAFDKKEQKLIKDAMAELQKILPCVRFGTFKAGKKPTGDYIKTVKGKKIGCNSHVGRKGGAQTMNLASPGCMTKDTVIHEMLHALGFHHEQERPDRDKYVRILWENIKPESKHNFNHEKESKTYGVPYNFHSVMHYDAKSFSKNGLPTIVAKNGQKIGGDHGLQNTDKKKLRAMYKCVYI